MRVLVFEDNLMWSARLVKSLAALGHEPVLHRSIPPEIEPADVAIVNLGSTSLPAGDLVPRLREAGVRVIAHAGHKEKELHRLGASLGCDTLATNSELTFKIDRLLEQAAGR